MQFRDTTSHACRLPVNDFGSGIIGFQLDPKAAVDSEGETTSKPTTGKGRKAAAS